MKTIDEVKAVVAAAWNADIELYWYIDENDEVRAAVNVNDTFFWGVSDCEDVEAEDVPMFTSASLIGEGVYTADIYAARKRGMRPQNAVINHAPPEVRKVLLEAGPERPVDFGNPRELEEK